MLDDTPPEEEEDYQGQVNIYEKAEYLKKQATMVSKKGPNEDIPQLNNY